MSYSLYMHTINGVYIVGSSRLSVCFNSETNKQMSIKFLCRRDSASTTVSRVCLLQLVQCNPHVGSKLRYRIQVMRKCNLTTSDIEAVDRLPLYSDACAKAQLLDVGRMVHLPPSLA
jgi:hypothetical protein